MIRYECGACRHGMESPEELAGTWQKCPTCGASVVVPSTSMTTLPPPGGPAGPPGEPAAGQPATQDKPFESPDSPAEAARAAEAAARRKKGWGNILAGAVLIVMGLTGLFGGSIFTGDADVIDVAFDLLGIGLIVWGIIQLATSPSR